jgi:hypothetical protein
VGDYEAPAQEAKVPSGQPTWTLVLTPAPKIADHGRAGGLLGPYVTFKAASPGTGVEALEELARRQRARTGCDLVFANTLGRLGEDVLLVGDQTRRFGARDEAVAALVVWLVARAGCGAPQVG